MNTGALLLIGAAGLGVYALSQSQGASADVGGAAGAPGPADSTLTQDTSPTNPLAGLGDLIKSFSQPSTDQPSTTLPSNSVGNTPDTKKAATVQSYVAPSGQTVNAANFNTSSGPAYVDSSGNIYPANFSSLITGGPAYAAPPSSSGSTKKAVNTSSLQVSAQNFTPAPNASMPAANFSSATQGAIYVPPPAPTYLSQQTALASSNLASFPSSGQNFSVAGYTFSSPGQYYSSQMQAASYVSQQAVVTKKAAQSTPVATSSNKSTNNIGGLNNGTYNIGGNTVTVKSGASGKYKTTL